MRAGWLRPHLLLLSGISVVALDRALHALGICTALELVGAELVRSWLHLLNPGGGGTA